jgi:hypothetical protein
MPLDLMEVVQIQGCFEGAKLGGGGLSPVPVRDTSVKIDASKLTLSNGQTSSSIALIVRELFKKWPRPFNSHMDNIYAHVGNQY